MGGRPRRWRSQYQRPGEAGLAGQNLWWDASVESSCHPFHVENIGTGYEVTVPFFRQVHGVAGWRDSNGPINIRECYLARAPIEFIPASAKSMRTRTVR